MIGKITVVNKKFHKKGGVYIGRGSPLGNPYSSKPSKHQVIKCKTVKESVDLFEEHLKKEITNKNKSICDELNRIWKLAKTGHDVNLVCFCKSKDGHGLCHGGVG